MLNKNIRPSTLEGIKRLAKTIKNERKIKHADALNDDARIAGFQNLQHAKNTLEKIGLNPSKLPYTTYITVYWTDSELGTGGRETLTVGTTEPISNLVDLKQRVVHRAISRFAAIAPDHLVKKDGFSDSQSQARDQVCACARFLQFADATKLRTSQSHSRAYPKGNFSNAIPGRDHYSVWYDRKTRKYLFVDEPYAGAMKDRVDRDVWAKKHNYHVIASPWQGMYNPEPPNGSQMYLVSDAINGVEIGPVYEALMNQAPPILASKWNGESAAKFPFFVSPGDIKETERPPVPRPSKKGARNSKTNTVEFHQTFAETPQRRPNKRMTLEEHKTVGNIIKSVIVDVINRKSIYRPINSVRCTLDEWLMREYTVNELPMDKFNETYYQEDHHSFAKSLPLEKRQQHIEALSRAKDILIEAYPECSPLRAILKKMDTASSALEKWGA